VGGHDGGGGLRWLLTYADLITLLLVFFIILYAMAAQEPAQAAAISEAVSAAFAAEDDQPFPIPGEGAGKKVIAPGQHGNLKGAPSLILDIKDATRVLKDVHTAVRFNDEQIAVDIRVDALFMADGVTLRDDAKIFLNSLGGYLMGFSGQFEVTAYHPSALPATYAVTEIWDLTSLQAVTIVNYLITESKCNPAIFSAWGLGPNVERVGFEKSQVRDGVTLLILFEKPR